MHFDDCNLSDPFSVQGIAVDVHRAKRLTKAGVELMSEYVFTKDILESKSKGFDRKTSSPSLVTGTAFVNSIESLKQTRKVLLPNSRAIIFNFH